MAGSRESSAKVYILADEMNDLEHKIAKLKNEIEIAKHTLLMNSRQHLKFISYAEEKLRQFNVADRRLDRLSTYGERQDVEELKKSVSEANRYVAEYSDLRDQNEKALKNLTDQLATLERALTEKIQTKLSAEETTQKLFKKLGLSMATLSLSLPLFHEKKSAELTASAKTSRDKVLQLQSKVTAELFELQTKYNQELEQIEKQVKSEEAKVGAKLALA